MALVDCSRFAFTFVCERIPVMLYSFSSSLGMGNCSVRRSSSVQVRARAGLTIIEVLIATTMTLLMMLALAQGFKTLSDSVSAGRSKLTLSDQLRGISSLLRSDLDGSTVTSNNPQTELSPNGYFKYYDGPLSDASATLFNYLPTGTVEQRVSANRWGDIDDIVMFTCKAPEGEWFRGKVPMALILISNLNNGIITPGSVSAVNWNAAWETDVSIASQYGEVAWFMRPLQDSDVSASSDVSKRYPINIQELMPYGVPPETSVEDLAPGVDLNGDSIPDPDGMPDRVALCRRVLLIRPDLNIAETAVTSVAFAGRDPQLTMKPLTPVASSVNSYRYMMRFAYQRCDLSVRPITNEFVSGTSLTLQTNSVADLQRPENRFAHYTIPLSALELGAGTSMPILALTSEAGSTGNFINLTNQAYGTLSPASPGLNVRPADRGFIPSCFFRTKIQLDSSTGAISSVVPTLEEVVASNVVAFDWKGYDLSMNLLASPGPDGGWGATGIDDDNDGTVDNVTESGWPGTDDLSLTPSDPGFSKTLINGLAVTSSSGAYVDLDWPRKIIHAPHRLAGGVEQLGMANTPALPVTLWPSDLSCVHLDAANRIQRTTSMVKSGCYMVEPTNGVVVYQPCFDTFTDAYESDGEWMEFVGTGGDAAYVAWRDGFRRFGVASPQSQYADLGTDGLGNDANERETSPPIPYKLPSIQVSVRVQDYTAGTLQQISVVHKLN